MKKANFIGCIIGVNIAHLFVGVSFEAFVWFSLNAIAFYLVLER